VIISIEEEIITIKVVNLIKIKIVGVKFLEEMMIIMYQIH